MGDVSIEEFTGIETINSFYNNKVLLIEDMSYNSLFRL